MSETAEPRNVTTPNLGLNKPLVGGDDNAWGGLLNSNADTLDSVVVPVTGGAMSGALTLFGDPTSGLMAATKSYVDANSSRVAVGLSAPGSPYPGQLWWDSTGGQLYIRYADPNSTQWVQANSTNGNDNVLATGSTTPRTLQDRFAEVVNVRDFGAKGDGTTDDTAAIDAALAVGGAIYFPSGTYRASTAAAHVIKSGTRLYGDGSARSIIQPFGGVINGVFVNTLYSQQGAYPTTPTTPAAQTDVNMSIEAIGFDMSQAPGSGIVRFLYGHNILLRDLRCDNGQPATNTSAAYGGPAFLGCDQISVIDCSFVNIFQACDFWKGCTRIKLTNLFAEQTTGGGNGGVVNFQGQGSYPTPPEHCSDLQVTNATIRLHNGVAFFLDSFTGGSTSANILLENVAVQAQDGSANQAVVARGSGGRLACRNFNLSAVSGAAFNGPFVIGGFYSNKPAYTAAGIVTTTSGSASISISVPNGTDLGPGNFVSINNGSGGTLVGNGLSLNGYYPVTGVSGTPNLPAGTTGTIITATAPANATASGVIAGTTQVWGYLGSFSDCDLTGVVIDGAIATGTDIIALQGSGHHISGVTVTQNYPVQYRSVVSVDGTADYSKPHRASWIGDLIAQPGTGALNSGWSGDNTVQWQPFGPAPVRAATQSYVNTAVAGSLPLVGGTLTGGLVINTPAASSGADLSQYITLHSSGNIGFNYDGTCLNYSGYQAHLFWLSGSQIAEFTLNGLSIMRGNLSMPVMTNAANDGAAGAAGVGVGQFYRNGSVVMQRVV